MQLISALIRRLSSVRLTLYLLFALAVLAGVGTVWPLPQNLSPQEYERSYPVLAPVINALGLDDFHTSLPHRALFVLLTANLLSCGVGRSLEGFRNMRSRGAPGASCELSDREAAARVLAQAGFAVNPGQPLRAAKRRWVYAAFGLVHLAPVVVIAGAFIGTEAGSVVTSNIYVGELQDHFYDWSKRADVTMPFVVRPQSMRREYHPIRMRLQLFDPEGGDAGIVEVEEGERFDVEGTPYSAVVERFLPQEGDALVRFYEGERLIGVYDRAQQQLWPVKFAPVAWKGEIKQVWVMLEFFDHGSNAISQQEVYVNGPANVMGYRVYMSSWGFDDENRPYVGLQISNDPGQWLVWGGATALTVGIFLLLFMEGAWVREQDGLIIGRSSRNRRRFKRLLERAGGGG